MAATLKKKKKNWAKQSACATSLDENAVSRTILLGSKNDRKGMKYQGQTNRCQTQRQGGRPIQNPLLQILSEI